MSAGLHLTININSAPNFKIQKGQHRSRVDSKAVANPFHDSRTSVHFFTAIRHLLTCIAPRGARGGSLISRFNKNYRQIWRLSSQIWIQILCQVKSGDTFTAMGDVFFSTSYQNTTISNKTCEAIAKSRSVLVVNLENYEKYDISQYIFTLHFIYFHTNTTNTTTAKDNYVTLTPANISTC